MFQQPTTQGINKLTVECDILGEVESFCLRELDCINLEIVTCKAPGEVLLRNQRASELAKGHLVINEERGILVNYSTLVLRLGCERLK